MNVRMQLVPGASAAGPASTAGPAPTASPHAASKSAARVAPEHHTRQTAFNDREVRR